MSCSKRHSDIENIQTDSTHRYLYTHFELTSCSRGLDFQNLACTFHEFPAAKLPRVMTLHLLTETELLSSFQGLSRSLKVSKAWRLLKSRLLLSLAEACIAFGTIVLQKDKTKKIKFN